MRACSKAQWRLICFPGAPSHTFLFKRLLQLAPENLDIIVVNRLGYGKTHNQPVLNFQDQVKIIDPFLNDKRNIVLGSSYGGALALNSALTYMDKIEAVITCAALIREPHDYAKTLVDLDIPEALTSLAPKKLQRMRAEIHGRRLQIGPLLDRVKSLNIPIEVLHGTLDTLVPKEDAQYLAQLIGANANYTEIIGGTHYLEMQFPQQIFNAVERVIRRIEGG